MRTRILWLSLSVFIIGSICLGADGKSREEKVREDKAKVEADGFWLYNDIPGALAEAKKTGKPILVVLRCLPCEECVKLDDELVEQDPVIQKLLKQFVCVRVVGTNGLDLETFQYDTDQSFAVFMLNADKQIYGRFGTRSHRTEWVGDVSLKGMAKALEAGLKLHADYPNNKSLIAGKRGDKPLFKSPELFPSLKDKYTDTLNYKGDVVKSCIHCHQIGDAERDYYRVRKEPIPEKVLFPYPHPKALGLVLDPKERATLLSVTPNTPASQAGFKTGDQIEELGGQALVSMADVQWVLHNTSPEGAKVPAKVLRDGKEVALMLDLQDGWRRLDEINWRVSSWGLRRMSTGGLKIESTTEESRKKADVIGKGMALTITHVGQYGAHAAAKRAGFQVGDIIISVNGKTNLLSEDDLLVYGVSELKPGTNVPAVVVRNDKQVTLQLPIQE